jgi:hypothetical protein
VKNAVVSLTWLDRCGCLAVKNAVVTDMRFSVAVAWPEVAYLKLYAMSRTGK